MDWVKTGMCECVTDSIHVEKRLQFLFHVNVISYKIIGYGLCPCPRRWQRMNKSQKKKAGCTISWSNARAPTVLKDGRPRSPCHFLPCRALVICRQDAVEVISIKDLKLL